MFLQTKFENKFQQQWNDIKSPSLATTAELQDNDNDDGNVVICNYLQYSWCFNLTNMMLIAASRHIENENKMTEHTTDALKILILQLLLE